MKITKEMLKSLEPNRYNLDIKKIKKLKVNRDNWHLLSTPLFWRNDVIKAWCISESVGPYFDDSSYWIGIYDIDAPTNPGKLKVDFTCHGDMCRYVFNTFYNSRTINNMMDLQIQSKFLSKINKLMDLGVLEFE